MGNEEGDPKKRKDRKSVLKKHTTGVHCVYLIEVMLAEKFMWISF